jgi:hypothetical protein
MSSFKKQENSLVSLGVGQTALITKWLNEIGVENYIINDDLTINAYNVHLQSKNLYKFPEYIQFNEVKTFNISSNYFINLVGCPKEVNRFFCSRNNLQSLEGCPKIVYDCFWCTGNKGIRIYKTDILQVCEVNLCEINL